MKTMRTITAGLAVLPIIVLLALPLRGADADKPLHITSISVPQGGATTIIFHGGTGPYRIEVRNSADPSAGWFDVPEAKVTELQPGVFMGIIPRAFDDVEFYRVRSEKETITDLKGWTILVQVSAPANRQYFTPGESPVVTVRILDTFAQGITPNDFASLNLYMYGPQDPKQTVTASKLLNASTDRAARPHHYIDLKKNPEVQVQDNALTYRLRAVTDEAPGTYTLTIYSVLAADGLQQIMKFGSIQIGTAEVENPVVTKVQCAACHQGAISGKMYLHHVDPSRSPTGSWAIDYEPVKTCKSCHNNDGYSAIRDATGAYMVDPIIRRVHGVHMGKGLKLDFNTNPDTGDFRDYTDLHFPADVRNCTVCHVDDRWKTNPSRLACGTCHDNVWFGEKTALPAGMEAHPGGTQLSDTKCWKCHDPGGPTDEGLAKNITDAHLVPAPPFKHVVKLEMSPPGNGSFYVAGDAPRVTIKVTDAATGAAIDPMTIVEPLVSTNVAPNEWKRANFYASGPRHDTVPVLTTAAEGHASSYYANNDFRVRLDPAKEDPRVTRTADSIVYQLDTITDMEPGTYTAFAEIMPGAGMGGWAFMNFQVGSTNVEPMVASSCTDCHRETRMHAGFFSVKFNPDICKNCHDYYRQTPGKTAWSDRNKGFGAAPLARRVHGVHFGNYLDKPLEIHPTYGKEFGHIIFPQDVRNCTKCHSQSSHWNEEPSRLACLACHDSDLAITHATLMTFDSLTPEDPWSGDEIETCIICHGEDSQFSAKNVHSISNPYVPPYPRAPREEEVPVLTPLEAANVARGGALYDKWWAVRGLLAPTTNHPLWASRPDTTSNTRTGSITWQCKECHGWDYQGVDGAYGSGSHRTGIRGIFGTTRTGQQIFDLVKTGHGYGDAGLTDGDVWDVAKFVLQGQIDTAMIIDANKKFTGSTARGETLYQSGIGSSTSCKTCHGLDGLTPPPDYPAFDEYPGLLSNENPWEFQHKVRFGQPGTPMPSAVAGGGTLQDVADVAAYCQTLPQARPAGNVAGGVAGPSAAGRGQ